MELVIVGLTLGAIGVLWHKAGKPWCDRVSEASRYPRLTRIGLVTVLYAGMLAALGVVAFIAQVVQAVIL